MVIVLKNHTTGPLLFFAASHEPEITGAGDMFIGEKDHQNVKSDIL
jgi:hypothetical protein